RASISSLKSQISNLRSGIRIATPCSGRLVHLTQGAGGFHPMPNPRTAFSCALRAFFLRRAACHIHPLTIISKGGLTAGPHRAKINNLKGSRGEMLFESLLPLTSYLLPLTSYLLRSHWGNSAARKSGGPLMPSAHDSSRQMPVRFTVKAATQLLMLVVI